MPRYLITFRAVNEGPEDPAQEAEWGQWFGRVGSSVLEGARVGQRVALGASDREDGKGLSGYVVVTADTLEAAVALASDCPALNHDGGVDVGELLGE